uniref:FBA_2 domain-containing protein n=1 Tax=Steinernema glaseri TaxID=37863 RepID=A0A1I7XYS0_9BILA
MLAMDRRYIWFTRITINGELEIDDSFWTTCSKEEIFSRLIPFLVRQLRPGTLIDFIEGLSRQDARMYFDAFLSCKGFRERCSFLWLPYYGPESEQFLATLLEGDCNLQGLSLVLDWPHSETVERLVLQFLGGRPCRLDIYDQSDASPHAVGNLRLNSTILKALFDAWYRKEKFGHFGVCANWDGDLEPVLSIPVPPNVTRTQLKPKKQEDNIFPMPEIKYYILWTREDESALVCVIRSTTVEFTTRQPMIEMFKEYDEMNVTV